jgi:hypothetical protein
VDPIWEGRKEQVRMGRAKNSGKARSRTNKDDKKRDDI